MPGIIIFKRRWSVGSDDMILPSFILLLIHTSWLVILSILITNVREKDWRYPCMSELYEHTVGYLIILGGCVLTEVCICWVSSRGTIMETKPRAGMQYLLYVRFVIFLVEIVWLGLGIWWLCNNYDQCDHGKAKDFVLAVSICNGVLICVIGVIGWCSFDSAGRSWVKMKRYQNSLKENQSKYRYKRSGSTHRNWRHRKAVRQYQDSWNRRCQLLFCCLGRSDRHQSSFTEIAKLLSEFFRDLDVVPSDVIAGLIIIRKQQKLQRELIAAQRTGGVYQFLSGVAISNQSRFLDFQKAADREKMATVAYYLDYAMAVYGWPMYMMLNKGTGCCRLCPYVDCSGCCWFKNTCCFMHIFKRRKMSDDQEQAEQEDDEDVPSAFEDNCCSCNYAAMQRILCNKNYELIYSTYHVEIGEPPFLVAVDHTQKAVVISVRGTLSLQDIITDLNAEGDIIPIEPPVDQWLGHKGMIEAAVYIRQQLTDLRLVERALAHGRHRAPQLRTQSYTIVLVGHSLGAGTASILAIMLRQKYPDLTCYAYSPPGGLLTLEAAQYSRSFITSVVLGKDVVPRLGLHQMESLRFDLITAIQQCRLPKWRVIGSSACCCVANVDQDERLFGTANGSISIPATDSQSIGEMSAVTDSVAAPGNSSTVIPIDLADSGNSSEAIVAADSSAVSLTSHNRNEKELSAHPNDASIALTVHQPLYPPGQIIHIVRSHVQSSRSSTGRQVVYQALYADNIDFDQILITPVMISDHMPNRLVDALSHLLHEPHESQERYRSTLGINRPLLDQSARPLLAYEYGSGWSETRAHTMTAVQPRSALNHDTRYGSNQYTSNQSQPIEQDRTDSHSINPSGLNSKGSTVVPVDLAVDDWIGTAPLATPEVASESSSVCSHSRTGSMAKRNVKTVSELIQAAVTTTGPNDPRFGVQWNGAMPKLDLELNIDVNALFDQWNANNPSLLLDVRAVADSPVSASENPVNMKNGLTTDSNDADLKTWKTQDPESNHDRKPCANVNALQASLPAIKKMGRASSLRRAGSVSSGKRVAFESKALMDGRVQSKSPNSTLIASCSLFGRVETAIRRVNSERISSTSTKRRVFAKLPTASRRTTNQSTSFEISNNQLTNAMTNTSGQLSALGSSSNRGTDLKVNEEETENWTNEQLEQELQRMLVTKSFAFHHHLEMSPDSDPSLMTSKSTKNSTES